MRCRQHNLFKAVAPDLPNWMPGTAVNWSLSSFQLGQVGRYSSRHLAGVWDLHVHYRHGHKRSKAQSVAQQAERNPRS